jgi:hypothetical protein
MRRSDSQWDFGLVIGFTDHLLIVTASKYYNSLTELHTPNITVITAHMMYSQSPLVVSSETDFNTVRLRPYSPTHIPQLN